MIDFSEAVQKLNTYDGVAAKIKVQYNDKIYMLKFDEVLVPDANNPKQASYANTTVSEYLGCHVFESCGIPTQDTVLGTYNGQKVVACEDFILNRQSDHLLQLVEFMSFETSYLYGSSGHTRTPELTTVLAILDDHPGLEDVRQEAKDRFWEMVVVDALNGNFDRHTGNWGYIYDTETDTVLEPAPIYDCGSSFYPKLDEEEMTRIKDDRDVLTERIMDYPRATLAKEGKKYRYQDLLMCPKLPELRQAVLRIYPRIDLNIIDGIIDATPFISDVKKEFHSSLIALRKELLLKPAYEMACKEQYQ